MFKYYYRYVLGHKQIEKDIFYTKQFMFVYMHTYINILVHYMPILLVNNQNYYINELA